MKKLIIFFLLLTFFQKSNAQVAGELDTSFGVGGKLKINIRDGFSEGTDIKIQTDGKIVAVGNSHNGSDPDFTIIRYNVDGSLDNTFGANGKVIIDNTIDKFGSYYDFDKAYGIDIQIDGKIVVVGTSQDFTSTSTSRSILLIRLNSNGTLDNTFGSAGKVILSVPTDSEGSSVAVQSDGKIVVIGTIVSIISNQLTPKMYILRFNSSGSVDTTFGNAGSIIENFSGYVGSYGLKVRIQSDGKIVAIGKGITFSSINNFAIARYNTDGSLDLTFDTDGKVVTSNIGTAISGMIQSDGKVVVVGSTPNTTSPRDFIVARYQSNGALDTSFDTDGSQTINFYNNENIANAVVQQSDGKLIIVGTAENSSYKREIALVRLNGNGSVDNTFGTNGKVITAVGTQRDGGNSAVLQANGKILVVGKKSDLSTDTFSLINFNVDGTLNTAFNTTGKVFTACGSSSDKLNAMLALPNGQILLGGGSFHSTSQIQTWGFASLNSDGTLNSSFGNNGKLFFSDFQGNCQAMALQSDGKIIAVGFIGLGYQNGFLSGYFSIIRLNQNGTLDNSFGTGGIIKSATISTIAKAVAIQSDGKIVVCGHQDNSNNGTNAPFVNRYNSDGSLDTGFGTNGTQNLLGLKYVTNITIDNFGRLLISGFNFANNTYIRLNSNGSFDTSFGANGVLATSITGCPEYSYGKDCENTTIIQNSGKIIAAADSATNTNAKFIISRYLTNGNLDNTFIQNGKLKIGFNNIDYARCKAIVVQSDKKIVLIGKAVTSISPDFNSFQYTDFAVARVDSNGVLDVDFNNSGKLITDFGLPYEGATTALVQADEKIIVGGYSGNNFSVSETESSGYSFSIARYHGSSLFQTITTGNWNANNTWNTNTPPTATKTAKINSTHTVSIPNTGNQVKTIQMNGGVINLNGGTLEIKNQ